VHAREGDGHHRVAEHPQLEHPGLTLAGPSGDREAAWRAAQREHALVPLARSPAPDEDARGSELEAAQSADLHLERTLDAADPLGLGLLLLRLHRTEDSLVAVRKHLLALLALLLAALLACAVATASPPRVQARAVLVADGGTGDVLYELNADRRLAMASITKLMTAVVTLEHARPRDVVTVSPRAVTAGESSIFLAPGEQLTVRELLAAALIQSANDSAFALAAEVGGGSIRRFVGMMNAKAGELGLGDTHYVRPDGLDRPGHYSTARDTFELAQVAMRQPLVRKLVRKRTAEISPDRTLTNWNDLLWSYAGLIGVKTGHTDRAGWSEVAAAKRTGTTLYAVLLGSPSRERRNADLAKLLDWGFDQYVRYPVLSKGERYATAAVPFEEDERLDLVAAAGASEVVRLGDGSRFVQQVTAPETVDLPVEKGEKLGEVVVLEEGREVARTDLVAAWDVPEPSLQERVSWYADRALDEAGDIVAAVIPGL
jgi:serine-type D-Ala-D-Ala carboxypeptidase (penicillin-binding protein 5/6)